MIPFHSSVLIISLSESFETNYKLIYFFFCFLQLLRVQSDLQDHQFHYITAIHRGSDTSHPLGSWNHICIRRRN